MVAMNSVVGLHENLVKETQDWLWTRIYIREDECDKRCTEWTLKHRN